MNGSSVANTSPNVKSKEDQGLNGHDEKENPFAEYMWMENEEDFNRQVKKEEGGQWCVWLSSYNTLLSVCYKRNGFLSFRIT